MQITCEKCQTSYVVDDKLIPAAGAPVQCTRCGSTFTAYPPPARPGGGKTVMMFSQPGPAAQSEAATPPLGPSSARTEPAAPSSRSESPTAPVRPVSGPAFWGAQTMPAAPAIRSAPPVTPATEVAPSLAPVAAPPIRYATPPAGAFAAPAVFTPAQTPIPTPPPRLSTPPAGAVAPPAPAPSTPPVLAPSAPPAADPGAGAGYRPGKVTQMFFNQGAAVEQANKRAQVVAAGEANRKPGQTAMFMAATDFETKLAKRSRGPIIGAALAILALVAGIVVYANRQTLFGPPGSDKASLAQVTQALSLLRLDDAGSLKQADEILAGVVKSHPKYLDAQGLRALVLLFRADDLSRRVNRMSNSYLALQKEVAIYQAKKQPDDWLQKVNADIAKMKEMRPNYDGLSGQQSQMEKDAFDLALKVYKVAPDNLDAVRALAFYYADNEDPDKTAAFVKKYVKLLGKHDGWSELVSAELAAHGPDSPDKRAEGSRDAKAALSLDAGLVRAHFLQVLLDVRARDEGAAKDDLASLAAANPKDDGGKWLLDGLDETLARERAEKAAQEAAAAAAAAATASPAPQPKHRRRR